MVVGELHLDISWRWWFPAAVWLWRRMPKPMRDATIDRLVAAGVQFHVFTSVELEREFGPIPTIKV